LSNSVDTSGDGVGRLAVYSIGLDNGISETIMMGQGNSSLEGNLAMYTTGLVIAEIVDQAIMKSRK
jgi:hypothetical protein